MANLVAHWKLNETNGLVASDTAGGNNGTLFNFSVDNSQWNPEQIDGAILFDEVDDYVEISGYKGVTGTPSRTVFAWIKTSTTSQIVNWGITSTG